MSLDLARVKADANAGFPLHVDDKHALIAEVERLQKELARAKAIGAAEELERMADAIRELTTEDYSPAIGEDDLRRKVAQLRKELE